MMKNTPRTDRRTPRRHPLTLALTLALLPAAHSAAVEPAPATITDAYELAQWERRTPGLPRAGSNASASGRGTVWTVSNCNDDGSPGSLRAVLAEVVSGDTVDLSGLSCSTITLAQGALDTGVFGGNHVYQLTLLGPGRDQLTIDGNGASQVITSQHFNSASARLTLRDLSLRGGSHAGGLAACVNSNGRVELERVDISDCHATGGGPAFASAVNAGFLSLVDSTITGSTASTTGAGDSRVVLGAVYARTGGELIDSTISGNTITSQSGGDGDYYFTAGGGIYARGDLTIAGSTISGNTATTTGGGQGALGGGVFATGDLVIQDSTIDGNAANGAGGGVFKARFSPWGDPPTGTTLSLGNSTVSGNSAALGGGVSSARPATFHNSTIANNHGEDGAGGVLFNVALVDTVSFDFQSTLVADNTTGVGASLPADLGSNGTLAVTGANNLIVDAGALPLPADTIQTDPLLQPLADNGGPTRTHALGKDSPAIDAGNNDADLAFDQRGPGFPRVLGEAADIGAFEADVEIKGDLIFQNGFEIETTTEPVLYLHDDGDGDTNQGPPSSFDPDMLWGNYFLTESGGEVITEIQIAFGPTFPSLADGPVTFWLLDDPDMDFDPRNATALTSVVGTPDVFNDQFFTVQIPPTQVSGAFFVGASAKLLGGQDRPARVDTGHAGDRSWFFYAPEIAGVIDDLAAAPFGSRMDDTQFVIYPGAFMIRAVGQAQD